MPRLVAVNKGVNAKRIQLYEYYLSKDKMPGDTFSFRGYYADGGKRSGLWEYRNSAEVKIS